MSRRLLSGVCAAAMLACSFVADAFAQGAPSGFALASANKKPAREISGVPVGSWIFSPSLFMGFVYNANANQTQNSRASSWGERVVPSFTAKLDKGIHRTELYGLFDLQNYASSAVDKRTTVDAKAGFIQSYAARRDVTFRFSGDYTRQLDVFGGLGFASPNSALSLTSPQSSPTTVSPQVSPDRYNQFSGSASVQKTFNRAFVVVGTGVQHTSFDSNPLVTASRDGTVYTLTERTGFYVTPQIYAFLDPSVDWRRYEAAGRDSSGYRVTAGVGTDRPGMWQGEVFAGYQRQKNDTIGSYSGDVFGVRLLYTPTRFLTLRGTIDQTLGSTTISNAVGTASRSTSAILNVGYNGMPSGWSGGARFGFVHTAIVNSSRIDNGWLVGANVGYSIWRNVGITLDYQYKNADSNVTGQSFYQHIVSLGLTYKY